MITLLGADGLRIRWTFRPLSGADEGESQRPASPGKGTSLGGQEAGLRGRPNPSCGQRGESLGTRDSNGRPNTGARVRKLAFSGGLHPAQGIPRVGQEDDPNPSRQLGKDRMNRAGMAGDRGCQMQ